MFVTVIHERVQLDEGLVAHFAVIRPLSFVEAYVQPDVGRPHKGAAADAALEILCATLRLLGLADCWHCRRHWCSLPGRLLSFVREQERQRAKTLTTLLTLVRLLPRVQTDVGQEPGFLRERLVAVGALEGLLARVEPTVGLQVRGAAEGLAAVRAFKRPVPAVDYLVRHEVGRLVEVLATGVTPELPLLVVGGQVERQVGGRDEGFGAQAAAVRVQADAAVWASTVWEAAAASLTGWTPGWTVRILHRLLLG